MTLNLIFPTSLDFQKQVNVVTRTLLQEDFCRHIIQPFSGIVVLPYGLKCTLWCMCSKLSDIIDYLYSTRSIVTWLGNLGVDLHSFSFCQQDASAQAVVVLCTYRSSSGWASESQEAIFLHHRKGLHQMTNVQDIMQDPVFAKVRQI